MSRPFSHRIRVRYSDCDPQGHLFNAHYLTYFDIALTELWRERLGRYQAMVDGGVDMVVKRATVEYAAPARFDDEVDVEVDVQRIGTTSMVTRCRVARDGQELAVGEMVHVFVEVPGGTKVEVPPDVRAALEPLSRADPG